MNTRIQRDEEEERKCGEKTINNYAVFPSERNSSKVQNGLALRPDPSLGDCRPFLKLPLNPRGFVFRRTVPSWAFPRTIQMHGVRGKAGTAPGGGGRKNGGTEGNGVRQQQGPVFQEKSLWLLAVDLLGDTRALEDLTCVMQICWAVTTQLSWCYDFKNKRQMISYFQLCKQASQTALEPWSWISASQRYKNVGVNLDHHSK